VFAALCKSHDRSICNFTHYTTTLQKTDGSVAVDTVSLPTRVAAKLLDALQVCIVFNPP
jgi:hypothetical protein